MHYSWRTSSFSSTIRTYQFLFSRCQKSNIQQIQAYVAANHPELIYPNDFLRQGTIVPERLGLLPPSLPYQVMRKDAEYIAIPPEKRQQIEFVLDDETGLTTLHTANLPEIASKRVTLSFIAATSADQATIDFYGGLYVTPPI